MCMCGWGGAWGLGGGVGVGEGELMSATLNLCSSNSDTMKCAMSEDTMYPGPFA